MRELIVVEGRGDAEALRRALGDAEILWTEGFGLTAAKLAYIRRAAAERGVIICTDPDHAGEMIRAKLDRRVAGLRHVYLPQAAARNRRGDDIGWEYACPEAIRDAFRQIQLTPEQTGETPEPLEMTDLTKWGLAGSEASRKLRYATGRLLGLGECNAKQFLLRINRFQITRQEIEAAVNQAFEQTGANEPKNS
ncbi:MAG: DUF4093 domain-containing protein [Gracilibacteraceae bacterium]|jgi:ribonuclease M5|nr:DUF4093 domain-containing protein [Gracilibacteraceae bacterium]